MPQLGESIVEGKIVRWNKSIGDRVERDEPLFEVSTDKVDAEIPSPVRGVVTEIRVEVGETVEVDSVVAVVTTDGDQQTSAKETVDPPPVSVSGSFTKGTETSSPSKTRAGVFSPIVRKLAEEHGVELGAVTGTGHNGRVTKTDVLRYAEDSAQLLTNNPLPGPELRHCPGCVRVLLSIWCSAAEHRPTFTRYLMLILRPLIYFVANIGKTMQRKVRNLRTFHLLRVR